MTTEIHLEKPISTQRVSDFAEADRVADHIVAAFRRHGIDRVFGVAGGTIGPIYDALLNTDIEVIACQHESMAVYMAAGYARATGKPAVVAVTSGPGALNAITGTAAAFLDEAPVLVLTGETATSLVGRSPLQEGTAEGLDLRAMFKPVTRSSEVLWHPERAVPMIEQALTTVMSSPRGPAFLQLPVDVLQQAIPPVEVPATVPARPMPDEAMCRNIADMLHNAHRPALLLGAGARQPGVAELVLATAETLHCGVITDAEAKGVFPESHPLSLGVFGVGACGGASHYLAEQPDVLVTLGARLDDTTTWCYSPLLRPQGQVVQIDSDMRRLSRSYRPDMAMCADLAITLKMILGHLPDPDAEMFVERDQAIQAARSSAEPRFRQALTRVPHDPRHVPGALQRVWPEAAFTTDIGNHLVVSLQQLIIDRADGFHVAFGLGGMGGGVGSAIGLQRGYGTQRQVISICGDGSMLMVGNELATCVRYRIPVIFAVFNDGALGMLQHGFEQSYGRSHPWACPDVDFVGYARSLGAMALRVNDEEDLQRAAEIERSGPLVLDIPIRADIRAASPRDAATAFAGGRT